MSTLPKVVATLFLISVGSVFGWVAFTPYGDMNLIREWVLRISFGAIALIAYAYVWAVWTDCPRLQSYGGGRLGRFGWSILPILTLAACASFPLRHQPEEWRNYVVVHAPEKRNAAGEWKPAVQVRVGDTVRLHAQATLPESTKYQGKWYPTRHNFLWLESSDHLAIIDPLNGTAVVKKLGNVRMCARLYYTYLPLAWDMKNVDYEANGPRLTVRHGNNGEKACSTEITLYPAH